MHDTIVEMHDGNTFCAPLWMWRPKEGWFSLAGAGPDKIYLCDVKSAVNKNVFDTKLVGRVDVDLLAKAKMEGWVLNV